MTPWTCIVDGLPLEAAAAELVCGACGARYSVVDEVPVFGAAGTQSSAILDEIRAAAVDGSIDRAADAVCKQRDLLRNRFTTDWDFFLPAVDAARVVHVGPGFGDRTLALRRSAKEVIALVPREALAPALCEHAREKGADNVRVAVLDSLGRLPLPDASVDAVAMDAPGAAAFGVGGGDISEVVAEFRRVLAPGGSLMLGAGNRLFRIPGLNGLRPGSNRPTLDDALATEGGNGGGGTRLPLRPALRALARNGFSSPTLLAPLPRREEITIVIPVRERAVLRYFFDRLFRKNSPVVRAGLRLARLAATLDLIWWVVPDYFVVATLENGETDRA